MILRSKIPGLSFRLKWSYDLSAFVIPCSDTLIGHYCLDLLRMILRSFLDYFIGSSSHTSIILCTFIRLNSSFTDISFSFLKFVPTNPGLSSGLQDSGTLFWKTCSVPFSLFLHEALLLLVPMCSIVCILQAQKSLYIAWRSPNSVFLVFPK